MKHSYTMRYVERSIILALIQRHRAELSHNLHSADNKQCLVDCVNFAQCCSFLADLDAASHALNGGTDLHPFYDLCDYELCLDIYSTAREISHNLPLILDALWEAEDWPTDESLVVHMLELSHKQDRERAEV